MGKGIESGLADLSGDLREDDSGPEKKEKEPEKGFIDREWLKNEGSKAVEEKLEGFLGEDSKEFEAARLLARAKRAGVGLGGKKSEKMEKRVNEIKTRLIGAAKNVYERSKQEEDLVMYARYLSYLKYSGVFDGLEGELKEKKEEAIDELATDAYLKGSDKRINWSSYAMHVKYVVGEQIITDEAWETISEQRERLQADDRVSLDDKVVNGAVLRYLGEEEKNDSGFKFMRGRVAREVADKAGEDDGYTDTEVSEKLDQYLRAGEYGSYARLRMALDYGRKGKRDGSALKGKEQEVRKWLEDKKRGKDIDRYLVNGANLDAAAGRGIKGEEVVALGERGGEGKLAAGGETVSSMFEETALREGMREQEDDLRMTVDDTGPEIEDEGDEEWWPSAEAVAGKSGAEENIKSLPLEADVERVKYAEMARRLVENDLYWPDEWEGKVVTEVGEGLQGRWRGAWREMIVNRIDTLLDDYYESEAAKNRGSADKQGRKYARIWLNELNRINQEDNPKLDNLLSRATEGVYAQVTMRGKENIDKGRRHLANTLRSLVDSSEGQVRKAITEKEEDDVLSPEEAKEVMMTEEIMKALADRFDMSVTEIEEGEEAEEIIWEFEAVDAAGQEISDAIQCRDLGEATENIRQMGYSVNDIYPVEGGAEQGYELWTVEVEGGKGKKWKEDIYARDEQEARRLITRKDREISVRKARKAPFWRRWPKDFKAGRRGLVWKMRKKKGD